MKIAIFHLAFIYSGGGERLVLEEARGLAERGHQVTIFSPIVDKKNCFPDMISQFNIKTLVPNLPVFLPQKEVFQVLLACVLAPLLSFRFRKFNLILAANQPSLWLAFWVKNFFGIPYIAYLAQPTRFLYPRRVDQETKLIFGEENFLRPATRLMRIFRFLIKWADKISVKKANTILTNGEHAKRILEKTYKIKGISCPAGAYPISKSVKYSQRFQGNLRIGGNQWLKKPYILLTNRHFPQKRFEYAITALTAIAKQFPNVLLIITGGETSYTRTLKNLVKRLSMEEKVTFLGLVGEKDLQKLYSQAAVYVYTAPEEDFGMGIVEAMAKAVPVVGWRNGGPKGIVIDAKTGFLAKPFETADFADKIIKLLNDKKLAEKIGKAGLERARKRFSWKNHVDCLEKAFARVSL